MGHDYRTDRSRAVLIRDAALARVSRTRRWVIAGAAALTAGFAALVSAVAPGRTVSSAKASTADARTASAAVGGGSAIPNMPAPASSSDLGLQSPNGAPSPDQSQPQSAPTQPQTAPTQPQSDPQPAPTPAPAAPPSSGGGVVSGGS